MRIKLKTSICGHSQPTPDGPFVAYGAEKGDIVEFPKADAERMIKAGYAVAVEDEDNKKRG